MSERGKSQQPSKLRRFAAYRLVRPVMVSVISAAIAAFAAAAATGPNVAVGLLSDSLQTLTVDESGTQESEAVLAAAVLGEDGLPYMAYTAEEDRARLFDRVASAFYEDGVDGVAGLSQNAEASARIREEMSFLSMLVPLTADGHARFRDASLLLAAAAIAMVVLFASLGEGHRRLMAPGKAFFFAAVPAVLLTQLGPEAIGWWSPAQAGSGLGSTFSDILACTAEPVLCAARTAPLVALAIGLVMLASAYAWRTAEARSAAKPPNES